MDRARPGPDLDINAWMETSPMRTMTTHALHLMAAGLLTLASGACDDGETAEASTGSTTHESHGTHHHEGSGSTSHDHGSTAHDHDTTAAEGDGTTAGAETDGGTAPGSSGGSTSGGYVPPTAAEYCMCMLDHCHDLYHSTWGEDHVRSEQMCLASFEASPSVGMPAMMGDSQECRMHHCEAAAAAGDEALCDSAMGNGACQ